MGFLDFKESKTRQDTLDHTQTCPVTTQIASGWMREDKNG